MDVRGVFFGLIFYISELTETTQSFYVEALGLSQPNLNPRGPKEFSNSPMEVLNSNSWELALLIFLSGDKKNRNLEGRAILIDLLSSSLTLDVRVEVEEKYQVAIVSYMVFRRALLGLFWE